MFRNVPCSKFYRLPKNWTFIVPTASSEMRSVVSDVSVLSFVSDAIVPQLTFASTADFNQVEEYESDSDDSDNDVDIESEEPCYW